MVRFAEVDFPRGKVAKSGGDAGSGNRPATRSFAKSKKAIKSKEAEALQNKSQSQHVFGPADEDLFKVPMHCSLSF